MMLCGLRGPHKGETVWYHEEARHQGEKRKQRAGKHDTATLPASYHHLDCNMTRRWKSSKMSEVQFDDNPVLAANPTVLNL